MTVSDADDGEPALRRGELGPFELAMEEGAKGGFGLASICRVLLAAE